MAALVLGVLTIVVALGSGSVDLIVSNVGAVSASAPIYEANLLALVARVAGLFGLPAPESSAPLVGQIDLAVWIRSISADAALVREQHRPGSLYVAFMLLEQATFDRKIDALFRDPAEAASVRAAARPHRAARRALSVGQDDVQRRHGGPVLVRARR